MFAIIQAVGWPIWPLILASVIAVALIIERSITLRRARIVQGGVMADVELVSALRPEPQALVIVNSRKHALTLFRHATEEGLNGLVHLTTRQCPAHRRRILDMVKQRLKAKEACRLIATSLVEAGVDFDFPVGWRAEAGLDSVVQAAGRVNREGKRDWKDCTLTVFTSPSMRPEKLPISGLLVRMRTTPACALAP